MKVSINVKFKEALSKTLSKELYKTLLIDLLSFALIFCIVSLYLIALTGVSQVITAGASIETIQTALHTLNEEQLSEFSSSLQRFMIVFVLGALIVALASLFIFSYSRAYLWHLLREDSLTKKEIVRWMLLTIVLSFTALLILLVYLLFKSIFLLFTASLIVSMLIDAFFFIALLLLLFTIFYEFVKTRQIFFAIGNAFTLIKHHLKPIGILLLVFLVLGLLFSFIIQAYQRNYAIVHTSLTQTIVISALTLFYIALVRLFYTKSVLDQ